MRSLSKDRWKTLIVRMTKGEATGLVEDNDSESDPSRGIPEETELVSTRQRTTHDKCPYTLRKKTSIPKR